MSPVGANITTRSQSNKKEEQKQPQLVHDLGGPGSQSYRTQKEASSGKGILASASAVQLSSSKKPSSLTAAQANVLYQRSNK